MGKPEICAEFHDLNVQFLQGGLLVILFLRLDGTLQHDIHAVLYVRAKRKFFRFRILG